MIPPLSWLEAVRACLASASASTDVALRTEYLAAARARLQQTKNDVESIEALVSAQEKALAQLRGIR